MGKSVSIQLLHVVFAVILISQSTWAIDLGYLKCDPEANCVVQIIKILGKKVIIENPVCIAARAACRIKCGPLNDDANRYIRDYEKQINTIQQHLVFLNQQKVKTQFNLEQALQNDESIKKSELIIKEIQNNDLLLYQMVSEIKLIYHMMTDQNEHDYAEVQLLIEKSNLAYSTKDLILFYFKNAAIQKFSLIEKLRALELSLSQPIYFIQLQSLITINQQHSEDQLESLHLMLEDDQNQINLQNNAIDEFKKKIKEQEERKCPSNLF